MPAGATAVIVGLVATTSVRSALLNAMRGTHLYVLDAVAAIAIAGTVAGVSLSAGSTLRYTGPAWVVVLVAAALGLPVAVRRRWPLAVLAVVTGAAVAATLYAVSPVAYVPVALAIYLVGARVPGRRSPVAAALCLVALAVAVVALAVVDPPDDVANVPGAIALVWLFAGGTWACGRAVYVRRAHEERLAAERARQALAEERLRIAREVHDVVAHSMSLIAARAGIANHVAAGRPEEARAALRLIEDTSRTALRDMRRVLGILRAGSGEDAELAPAGLGGLGALVDRAREAGLDVELTVSPAPGGGSEPPGPALVAYRVVQEALTNVLEHAGATRCRVDVAAGEEAIRVTVTDDGPRGRVDRPAPPGGHGLVGMRERVAMYGGTFAAGPCPGGGFEVTAHVPYERRGEERA